MTAIKLLVQNARTTQQQGTAQIPSSDPIQLLPAQPHALPTLGDCHYTPNLVTPAACSSLVSLIHSTPSWLECRHRRLLNLGGIPHPSGMIAEPLPPFLSGLISALNLSVNQALINSYSGAGSISRHQDGPNFAPHAHILTLLGHALLYFATSRTSEPFGCVLLEPGSLFVFSGALYTEAFHFIRPGIASESGECFEPLPHSLCANLHLTAFASSPSSRIPRGPRISVTMRFAHLSQVQDVGLEERARRRAWWARAVGDG